MSPATGGALDRSEAFARIRLLRSPNVGPASYYRLLARFGSAVAAIDALPDLASRNGTPYRVADTGRIDAEIAAVRKAGARYVFHDGPDYPALLAAMEYSPPILTLRGDPALLSRPCVAVVGARNASAGAVRLSRDFAAALAARGYAVVSGLARGIDAAAHQGALAEMADGGGTIGVIASGIDIAYPAENARLQERVACEGALVAEMPPGTEPLARHFPQRNRIIAGLSAGTVVVEAAPRSGSLITARLAAEAGREVMAIPGSPLDGRSRGCNQLIREGAILVQSADDVIELLEGFEGQARSTFQEEGMTGVGGHDPVSVGQGSAEPARIEGLLSAAPVSVDELVRQSGGGNAAVQMALLELELAGRLQRHAGGRVSLA